jgi:hypothetical protein
MVVNSIHYYILVYTKYKHVYPGIHSGLGKSLRKSLGLSVPEKGLGTFSGTFTATSLRRRHWDFHWDFHQDFVILVYPQLFFRASPGSPQLFFKCCLCPKDGRVLKNSTYKAGPGMYKYIPVYHKSMYIFNNFTPDDFFCELVFFNTFKELKLPITGLMED